MLRRRGRGRRRQTEHCSIQTKNNAPIRKRKCTKSRERKNEEKVNRPSCMKSDHQTKCNRQQIIDKQVDRQKVRRKRWNLLTAKRNSLWCPRPVGVADAALRSEQFVSIVTVVGGHRSCLHSFRIERDGCVGRRSRISACFDCVWARRAKKHKN